jgi:hypothetical protein
MSHTNFGSESVLDVRLVNVGGKDIYQRKQIINGKALWVDVEVATDFVDTDDADTEEFNPLTDFKEVPDVKTDRVPSTMFAPQELKGVRTDPLIRKSLDDMRTIAVDQKLFQEYMDRFIRLHAILIRIVGGTPEDIMNGKHTSIDKLKKNSALREAVHLIIDVIGEPWASCKSKL